jgi:hypothetical protein
MQASGLVDALREDLADACSRRDELTGRLGNLEGPDGPLSRVRDLEGALQRVRRKALYACVCVRRHCSLSSA